MANDYRILDERDKNIFQAGNKLNVTEIGNKITYEHIGEPPNTLPSKEKVLEYGESFNITVPSVYDSMGHVKSETKYSFIMPQETDTSNFLTTDNFLSESPISVNKSGKNVTYSHDEVSMTTIIPDLATQLTYGGTFEIPALSAADGYGHATEQKTYKFQMPTAVNVSGFLKKDSFGSIDSNPVIKGENDKKQIAYSHKTLNPTSNNPPTVDLEYDKEFQFIALSATDGYGHANQNTTYKFKMPKASTTTINTSDFLKKTELEATFDAVDPLHVDITNNVVTYSHDTSSINSTPTPTTITPDNNIISLVALSAADAYGHATTNTKYQFTVPTTPFTKELLIIDNIASYELNNISLQNTQNYYITICPNASGYILDPENQTGHSKLIMPGSFTTFTSSLNNFNFDIPLLWIFVPDSSAVNQEYGIDIHNPINVRITCTSVNNVITAIKLVLSPTNYANTSIIKKIIITAY